MIWTALASQYDLFILTRMDEKERDYIQSLTTGPLFLQYLLFSEIQDPGSWTDQPNHNQVAELTGDFCELESNHPDWFLRDANGQVVQNDDGYVLMDPGNSKWRAYWLQRAQDAQALYGWQGVFLDNVEASLEKRTRYGAIPASYPDDASYQAAILDNSALPLHPVIFNRTVSRCLPISYRPMTPLSGCNTCNIWTEVCLKTLRLDGATIH